MKVIKKTRSLCPVCLNEIDAKIIDKYNKIFMKKKCKIHGFFEKKIEINPFFYKKTMNIKKIDNQMIKTIMVPITHKCNLNCNFCYVPNREKKDMSINELKSLINKLTSCNFCISGGEPTLHKDLFRIIKFLKKSKKIKNVGLATNGIKLSNIEYVKKLKEAGLDYVLYSFNGFSEKAYEKTNKQKLLSTKLKSLENLKKIKLKTVLSPTLIKGINEQDIKKIIHLGIKNPEQFFEIRIRSATKVGKYKKIKSFYTSEILEIVANTFNKKSDFFLKNFNPKICYHSPYQFNIRLIFTLKKEIPKLLYWDNGHYINKISEFFKIFLYLFFKHSKIELIKTLKDFFIQKYFKKEISKKNIFDGLKSLKVLHINIWGWPDKSNIDLNEINALELKHITKKGNIMPFFKAIMNAEDL